MAYNVYGFLLFSILDSVYILQFNGYIMQDNKGYCTPSCIILGSFFFFFFEKFAHFYAHHRKISCV